MEDEHRRSQDFMRRLKGNKHNAADLVARRLVERADPEIPPDFLENVLVPIPRSGLRTANALWPAFEIATALDARGVGAGVSTVLSRALAVPKAATSASHHRPTARVHADSLRVVDPLALPPVVTLVDDVVTRGSQLFGAAWAIWTVRSDVIVRAFAVIRTISDPQHFEAIAAPCNGTIVWRDTEQCYRDP